MSTAMAVQSNGAALAPEGRAVDASIIERVMAVGDLSRLQPGERVEYYVAVCRSVGLNPLTKPFDYINLNGKLTLYCTRNCTDQLRQIHGVSVVGLSRSTHEGVHIVTAQVATKDGRRDEDIGAVSIANLKGEALANALMKATTKAKRRATLSICGLSFVDESEIDSIPDARRVTVTEAGEIVDPPTAQAAQPDGSMFESLCAAIDAAETKADINRVALAAKKALAAGTLSAPHYAALGQAAEAKRRLLASDRPSQPRTNDEGPADEREPGEEG